MPLVRERHCKVPTLSSLLHLSLVQYRQLLWCSVFQVYCAKHMRRCTLCMHSSTLHKAAVAETVLNTQQCDDILVCIHTVQQH
jgi:hypothetical protein